MRIGEQPRVFIIQSLLLVQLMRFFSLSWLLILSKIFGYSILTLDSQVDVAEGPHTMIVCAQVWLSE